MTRMEEAAANAGACWRCDERLGLSPACQACNAPQPLPSDVDHFTVLGLPRSLVVDLAALERCYHESARRVHPDRHQTAEPRTLELSVATSATLNRAYRTLRDPVTRGRYWLEVHGAELGKDNNRVPPALATLVFETQEQLVDLMQNPSASARAAVESARRDVAARLTAHLADLDSRYRAWDAAADAETLAELKERLSEIAYLNTLLGDVEDALGA
jgi:molecular chaperone HscB